ncbi:MAG: hypothetical protein ISS18_12655 [Bacteroidales bacterium]|nr:hypothetical protein [Bacteroidales bacterium]
MKKDKIEWLNDIAPEFRNLGALLMWLQNAEDYNKTNMSGFEDRISNLCQAAIREVEDNFTENYRVLIKNTIDYLEKYSHISAECMNTADIFRNILELYPRFPTPAIGVVDGKYDNQRLEALKLYCDGISPPSRIDGKSNRLYILYSGWARFFYYIDKVWFCPEGITQPKTIDKYINMLDPRRRKKIKDIIDAWEQRIEEMRRKPL